MDFKASMVMLSCKPLYNLSLSEKLTLSCQEESEAYKKGKKYLDIDEDIV